MTNKLTEQIKKSGEDAEVSIFWDEIANNLPKSIERSALGDEKIFKAFRIVYPKIKSHLQIELLKVLKGEVEKAKVSHAPDCPYMYWRCECDFAVKEGGGYNNALSQVIELLDNTIKENI